MALAGANVGTTRALAWPRRQPHVDVQSEGGWTRADSAWALGWLLIAFVVRLPLLVRIEGLLDHDQGIVGLMALDIAAGRRWPIFFDGQRYMGALEAYIAAVFVKLLGHSPAVVALAPALAFGLFVAGQYALWRCWSGRVAGHLAALVATVGAPMLSLWGVAPRGGYSEILAWAIPVLAVYRHMTRTGAPAASLRAQFAWGFLLAFGYFLNPLSIIVYVTLLLDWTFGRHGSDLRHERKLAGGWVESPLACFVWLGLATVALCVLAVGCSVILDRTQSAMRFSFVLDVLPPPYAKPIGGLIVAAVLGVCGWWTGCAQRVVRLLSSHAAFALGMVAAWVPVLVYNLRVMLGWAPRELSLPIWIRAPWHVGPNLRDGLYALRPLVGCDPHAAAFSVVGQFLRVPAPRWPALECGLNAATPFAVALVALIVLRAAWADRAAWRAFWSLRGRGPTPPSVLALLGLAVCAGLYLEQATSGNSTSIRYLLPLWIFLPGLLAHGLLACPRRLRIAALAVLLGTWTAAQVQLWSMMAEPSPLRPVVAELERRGVTGIVASTHLILLAADLTQGRVGGLEYHSYWPRLHARFADRFVPGRPIVCVNDREYGRPPIERVGVRMQELALRHPGRVRVVWQHGPYEIWQADVPLEEVLELEHHEAASKALRTQAGSCPAAGDRRT